MYKCFLCGEWDLNLKINFIKIWIRGRGWSSNSIMLCENCRNFLSKKKIFWKYIFINERRQALIDSIIKWQKRNKDKVKEIRKRYYQRHKEQILNKYRKKNLEYYHNVKKHKPEYKEKRRRYMREYMKKYRNTEKWKEWFEKKYSKLLEYNRKYRKKYRELRDMRNG